MNCYGELRICGDPVDLTECCLETMLTRGLVSAIYARMELKYQIEALLEEFDEVRPSVSMLML